MEEMELEVVPIEKSTDDDDAVASDSGSTESEPSAVPIPQAVPFDSLPSSMQQSRAVVDEVPKVKESFLSRLRGSLTGVLYSAGDTAEDPELVDKRPFYRKVADYCKTACTISVKEDADYHDTFYQDELQYNCSHSKRIRLDGATKSRRCGCLRLVLVDFLGNRSRSSLLLVIALVLIGAGIFKWLSFGKQIPCAVVRRVDQPYLYTNTDTNSTELVYNNRLEDDSYLTGVVLRHNFVLAGQFLFTVLGNSPWHGAYWFVPSYALSGYYYSFAGPDVVNYCYGQCKFANSSYDFLADDPSLPTRSEIRRYLKDSNLTSLIQDIVTNLNVTRDNALHYVALQECDSAILDSSVFADIMFAWLTFTLMNLDVLVSIFVIVNSVLSWIRRQPNYCGYVTWKWLSRRCNPSIWWNGRVHYPTRLYGAAALAIMMVITMAIWFYVALRSVADALDDSLDQLHFILDTFPNLFPDLQNLADALEDIPRAARLSAAAGYVAGGIMFLIGIVQLFLNYRKDYIKYLDREHPPFSTEETQNNFASCVSFLGGVSNNCLCAFWFTWFIVFICVFLLTWTVTQEWIKSLIPWLISVGVSWFIGTVGRTLVMSVLVGNKTDGPTHPFWWRFWDLLLSLNSLLSGPVSALGRLGLALCFLIVYIPRINRSLFPPGAFEAMDWVFGYYVCLQRSEFYMRKKREKVLEDEVEHFEIEPMR
eukprot:CAMPEP_0174239756 /NCGR_PEP_ID=MMETSP0417-20130205/16064_1 /TAXON_ID=242541 /ORGANISM="Mayorella sp, Strain BSH-02190019" /LENGTH=704 /DNA_ID=CAMNT_0015318735 /DNA_START=9 /DNA_END=2123 /DNA_ORIENTATION=-